MPPSRTKIIATIGDPARGTYKNGIVDWNFEKKTTEELETDGVEYVVRLLLERDVDLLRVNLAHISLTDLPNTFGRLKKAIRSAEGRERRIGLLADLPGPKIRFDGDRKWVLPTEDLIVSLKQCRDTRTTDEKEPQSKAVAQINLDEKPFWEAAPGPAKKILSETMAAWEEKEGTSHKLLAFIGDNDCQLEVVGVDPEAGTISCKVMTYVRREIGGHKGFTIRGIAKPIQAFTDQDVEKLKLLLRLDWEDGGESRIVSHVGISFCQDRMDVLKVLRVAVDTVNEVGKFGYHLGKQDILDKLLREVPLLVAKIETRAGADAIDDILDLADGAMIARGDLALEMETTDVPTAAKRIIAACNLRAKPVIMATQMLESMKDSVECSRPEAADVFNAVADNVDAVMLSGETSSGRYPAHAVEKMKTLARNAEEYLHDRALTTDDVASEREMRNIQRYDDIRKMSQQRVKAWQDGQTGDGRWADIANSFRKHQAAERVSAEERTLLNEVALIKQERLDQQEATDRITHAACLMAEDPKVGAIVAPTTSGRTVRMLARYRPSAPIWALPHSAYVARQLTIDRGVRVVGILRDPHGDDDIRDLMRESARSVPAGEESLVFTCGTPLGQVGTTNLLQRWDPSTRQALAE